MKKKVFFAPRAVRIAIGTFSGIVIAGGSVAMFYAKNNTFKDLRNQESNERLVENAGVFKNESDYYTAKSALNYEKEAFQSRAMDAASEAGIIEQKTISNESIRRFLTELEKPDNHYGEIKSVADRDKNSVTLNRLISSLLVNSKDLKNEDANEFALKVATYKALAKIANSLDGQGSYVGVLRRAESEREILNYLTKYRMITGVEEAKKTQLFASCVETLQQPFDLAFMLKFEHLRVQKMINVLNGQERIEPGSKIFEQPKPLSFNEKVQLALPGVHLAWKSRVDELFTKAIQDLKGPHSPEDSFMAKVLGQTANKVDFYKSNTNYLAHYGLNFGQMCGEFAQISTRIYRIKRPLTAPVAFPPSIPQSIPVRANNPG